jgi:TldD protein
MKIFLLAALTAMSVNLGTAAYAENSTSNDVVFKALKDEMQRSTTRLHLDQYKGPYFVSYVVRQTDAFEVSASFGAVDASSQDRSRTLRVDVREGDYDLDSSHGGGGAFGFLGGEHGGSSLVVDDNYDAIRHELWLKTDAAYKRAIEDLASKKAVLQESTIKDPPDSMSREKPVEEIEPVATLQIDAPKAVDMVRRLSTVFKDYPKIQKSYVRLEDKATTRWFVNSEGFINRIPKNQCYLIAIASVQAANGSIVSDTEIISGEKSADLPAEAVIEKKLRHLAERLTTLAEAKEIDQYRGPILFEGEAAAEFVSQVLQGNLGYSPEPLSKLGSLAGKMKNPLADRLGGKILPTFITLIDDPTKETVKEDGVEKKILSSYRVDDDGLRPQKITLVEKGILKTFAMGRAPSREIKKSNGHARGSSGVANNLYLISDNQLSSEKLKEKLMTLGKENNVKEVLVARRLWNFFAASLEPQALLSNLMSGFMGGSELRLSPPVELYAIDVETGKETLVRGAQFGNLTLRLLRDIEATGNDTKSYLLFSGSNLLRGPDTTDLCTISTPSILVSEIELTKPSKQTSLPPLLKNPYFEQQEAGEKNAKNEIESTGENRNQHNPKRHPQESRRSKNTR